MSWTMFFTLPLLLVLFVIPKTSLHHLKFSQCNQDNWKCENSNNSTKLFYSCKISSIDQVLEVNLQELLKHFQVISVKVHSLYISNCNKLTLDMNTDQPCPIKLLKIQRIRELEFQVSNRASVNKFHPRDIILEDIALISKLKSETIACGKTEDIIFKRVNIKHIEPRAITNPSGKMSLLIWESVQVDTFSPESISIFIDSEGRFNLTKGRIGKVAANAIILRGGSASVTESSFRDIEASGIVADGHSFKFSDNTVRESMGRLAVTSNEITFERNNYGICSGKVPLDWGQFSTRKEESDPLHLIIGENSLCKSTEKANVCSYHENGIKNNYLNCNMTFHIKEDQNYICENHERNTVTSICGNTCLIGICGNSNSSQIVAEHTVLLFTAAVGVLIAIIPYGPSSTTI